MVWQYAIAGAIGYALLRDTSKDHDEVVGDVVDELEAEIPGDATIYADHVDRELPNPRGAFTNVANEPDHVPDVVVTSGLRNNIIIEVETGDAIEQNGSEAKKQIDDFSIPGYRRALVVPDADFDAVHVEEFEDDLDVELSGDVYVATPSGVPDLL